MMNQRVCTHGPPAQFHKAVMLKISAWHIATAFMIVGADRVIQIERESLDIAPIEAISTKGFSDKNVDICEKLRDDSKALFEISVAESHCRVIAQ